MLPDAGDPSPVVNAYEDFFSPIKDLLFKPYAVQMFCMTGLLPILFDPLFDPCYTKINKTFLPEFANLFGLTSSEISEALDCLYAEDKIKSSRLKELTCNANGYCFTRGPMEGLEPVFGPESTFHHLNVSYASRQ